MEFLADMSYWHWLVLGAVLGITEFITARGYLLGAAFAGLVIGGLSFMNPHFAGQQLLTFYVSLTALFSFIFWRQYRNLGQRSDEQ